MLESEKLEALEDFLLEHSIVTSEEYKLVTCIIGRSLKTSESILFARTGYRSLEQYLESE